MGIPCVDPCVDGCLQSLAQDAYGFVKKRWMILYHYKKNFADLEEKKKELEKQRGQVKKQVERAKEQGEEIIEEVSEWMVEEKKEVDDLMQRKTEVQSITCFNFSFPNCISRYQLSKRAEKEITALQKKICEGKFTTVSDPNSGKNQPPPANGVYRVFESREVVLKEVKHALKENDIVGIHGLGGIGKTIMAVEVVKQLQNESYIHEFAMATVSQNPDFKRIQDKLASYLKDFKLDEKENEEERSNELRGRLDNGKMNLVILDDVWGEINLDKIGIPVSGGKKNASS